MNLPFYIQYINKFRNLFGKRSCLNTRVYIIEFCATSFCRADKLVNSEKLYTYYDVLVHKNVTLSWHLTEPVHLLRKLRKIMIRFREMYVLFKDL